MTLTKSTSRLVLIVLVFTALVVNLVTLLLHARASALDADLVKHGVQITLGIYVPLLGAMLAFYQAEVAQLRRDRRPVDEGMLLFSVFALVFWGAGVPIITVLVDPIETAFELLEWGNGTVGGLLAGAIGLFFSRTRPQTPER